MFRCTERSRRLLSAVGGEGTPARRRRGPGCQLRLYFWDPEDNLIELYWGLDQIGWDGRARPYPPLTSIDLESFDVDAWLEAKGSELLAGAPPATAEPV